MAFFSKQNKTEIVKSQTDSKSVAVKMPAAPRNADGIILVSHITEKATRLAEGGTYVFKVASGANKHKIAEAIERRYKVHVEGVSVLNIRSKNVILGRTKGRSSAWRKAMVTLRKGETIAS